MSKIGVRLYFFTKTDLKNYIKHCKYSKRCISLHSDRQKFFCCLFVKFVLYIGCRFGESGSLLFCIPARWRTDPQGGEPHPEGLSQPHFLSPEAGSYPKKVFAGSESQIHSTYPKSLLSLLKIAVMNGGLMTACRRDAGQKTCQWKG